MRRQPTSRPVQLVTWSGSLWVLCADGSIWRREPVWARLTEEQREHNAKARAEYNERKRKQPAYFLGIEGTIIPRLVGWHWVDVPTMGVEPEGRRWEQWPDGRIEELDAGDQTDSLTP